MLTHFQFNIRHLVMILALGLAFWTSTARNKAVACDPEPCGSCFCGNWSFWDGSEPEPLDPWYVSADGIALQRTFRGAGPVATMGLGSTGTFALNRSDMVEPFSAGTRLLVGHTFDDSPYQIEASYYWLSTLDTSAQTIDPTGNLFSPFSNFGVPSDNRVDFNTSVAIHETSRLESGEIDLKGKVALPAGSPTMMLLFGLRHVGIREEFDYTSQPTKNIPVIIRAHTNNNLWGPQIGGLFEYGRPTAWFRFEGKVALCNNAADRDLEAHIGGVDAFHPRASQTNTAMVGDLLATILWRPTPHLTAKLGYQALWCDQLALAARNFSSDVGTLTNAAAEPPINQRGTVVYHGPFAGLQLNW